MGVIVGNVSTFTAKCPSPVLESQFRSWVCGTFWNALLEGFSRSSGFLSPSVYGFSQVLK